MSSTPFRASKKRPVAPRKLLKNDYVFQAIAPPRQSTYINNVDKKRGSESVKASCQENHENHIKSFTKIQPREFSGKRIMPENSILQACPLQGKPGRSHDRHAGIISMFIQFTLPAKTRIRFPDPEELMDTIIAIPVYHASGGVTSTVTPPVMSQKKCIIIA